MRGIWNMNSFVLTEAEALHYGITTYIDNDKNLER